MNKTSSPNIPEIFNHEITSTSHVLEKQQIDLKWQQDQLQRFQDPGEVYDNLGGIFAQAMKSDPGLEACWDDYASIGLSGIWEYGNLNAFDMNSSVARTLSCPPAVAAAMAEVATAVDDNGKETFMPEKQSSTSRKRKAEMTLNLQVEMEEESKDKKLKSESSITKEQKDTVNTAIKDDNNETSDSTKEKSKISEVQKPDYIHVRARRGQATDSHSLAERVRREKISERMKYLQNLVPGCDKVTGKAGMLDEIINYVQSLQSQVEFLSMKLAAISPGVDSNVENFLTKQVFPASTSQVHPAIEALNKSCLPPNYQPNSLQQVVSSCGLDISVDLPVGLRRTISAPVSIPGTVFESPCFSHLQSCSTWDAELQSIYPLEF